MSTYTIGCNNGNPRDVVTRNDDVSVSGRSGRYRIVDEAVNKRGVKRLVVESVKTGKRVAKYPGELRLYREVLPFTSRSTELIERGAIRDASDRELQDAIGRLTGEIASRAVRTELRRNSGPSLGLVMCR